MVSSSNTKGLYKSSAIYERSILCTGFLCPKINKNKNLEFLKEVSQCLCLSSIDCYFLQAPIKPLLTNTSASKWSTEIVFAVKVQYCSGSIPLIYALYLMELKGFEGIWRDLDTLILYSLELLCQSISRKYSMRAFLRWAGAPVAWPAHFHLASDTFHSWAACDWLCDKFSGMLAPSGLPSGKRTSEIPPRIDAPLSNQTAINHCW